MLEQSERPWGKWEDLFHNPELPYRVKKITVNPGGKLSLQYHHNRAEVWNVISGIGSVFISSQPFDEEADRAQSEIMSKEGHTISAICGDLIKIHKKHVHTVECPKSATEPFVFIEIQHGLSTEEDIIRLEDIYGREGT